MSTLTLGGRSLTGYLGAHRDAALHAGLMLAGLLAGAFGGHLAIAARAAGGS